MIKDIRKKSAEILIKIGSVSFNVSKPFKLTSGKLSPIYCDCRKIISFPQERNILMNYAVELLKKEIGLKKIDFLAGGETAGIPFASFLASKLQLPMIYIRKKTKDFGKKKKIEGRLHSKSNVVLVEDLITDGGSKKHFLESIENEDSNILATLVIFNYGIFNKKLKINGFNSKLIFLATWKDVLSVAKSKNLLAKSEISEIKKFLSDFGVKN